MFEAEMHKFYEVTLPSGINDTGRYEICQNLWALIKKHMTIGYDDPCYRKAINYYSYINIMPETWNWQYTVNGKGKYVGTFTRRISKYIKLTFGFDLTEAELSTIGTLARNNCSSEMVMHVDFDDKLNWNAGDFGDRGSCYWSGNKDALLLLRKYEALAVRVWRDDHTKGTGRAWLIPPAAHGLGNFMIVLNGCGGSGRDMYEYGTLWFARLLGVFWGLEYHIVSFYGGNVSTNIYGSSDSAYIVGSLEEVMRVNNVELNWQRIEHENDNTYNDNDNDNDEFICCNCEYSSNNEDDDFIVNNNGYRYCHDCYYAKYAHCYQCGEELYIEDAAGVDGDYYCDKHALKYLIRCDYCNDYERKRDAITVGVHTLCNHCGNNTDIIAQYEVTNDDD